MPSPLLYYTDAQIGLKTGMNATTGAMPFRRDILDLVNDTPSFTLFILALNKMMETEETALTSYFQVAGMYNASLPGQADISKRYSR